MAYEVDREWGATDFHPARFTVDLYRVPKFAPVEVASRVVRDGNRIKVIDAEFTSNGESIARASALLLHLADMPCVPPALLLAVVAAGPLAACRY
ncbi:hypothetical protein NL529_27450, partial [Klebsiella pneumoniae]|nr:hypothetical protein [Klebsiella pneumoniae]